MLFLHFLGSYDSTSDTYKNMHRNYLFRAWILLILFIPCSASNQIWNIHGQFAGWSSYARTRTSSVTLGLRYIPTLEPSFSLYTNHVLDLELSINAYYKAEMQSRNTISTNQKAEPYRLWVRYFSDQFESRLGLQKISFGPAIFFRPLMWFDTLDPRDPLQLTHGVYALLFRYYFLNNANAWLWGLYGNERLKGWDSFTSAEKTIEFGGRVQYPFLSGEVGLSYHQRRFEYQSFNPMYLILNSKTAPEQRFGLDAKWDWTVGLWIESSFTHQVTSEIPYSWQRGVTIGCDYTFDLGNGLTVISEYFTLAAGDKIFYGSDKIRFSALAGNYPFGLLDLLEAIFYYDWKNEKSYRFIDWKRTYDNWVFYLMVFWNPDQTGILPSPSGTASFSGKGIQFMVTFNH